MKALFDQTKKRLHEWLIEHAESPTGMRWLALVSFIEEIFFPLPVDVMLVAYISVKNTRWFRAAMIASVFSALGAVVGYLIGYWFFDTVGHAIISFYHLEDAMFKLGTGLSNHNFWTTFIVAFTPLPDKVFIIGAGFFKINFWIFIVAMFIGRIFRFVLISYLAKLYGYQVARFIYKYFDLMAIAGIIVMIVGIVILLS